MHLAVYPRMKMEAGLTKKGLKGMGWKIVNFYDNKYNAG